MMQTVYGRDIKQITPGEIIKEKLESIGMSHLELSFRLGITPKHLSNIVNNNASITYETALKLENVLDEKAEFWLNIELASQLEKARIKEIQELTTDFQVMEQIPYHEMVMLRWIKANKHKYDKVKNLRNYFGVSTLLHIKDAYNINLKQEKDSNFLDFKEITWIRKAQIESARLQVGLCSRNKVKKMISEVVKFFGNEEEGMGFLKLKEFCVNYGIALVYVEPLNEMMINSATLWQGDKVVIALSSDYKDKEICIFGLLGELTNLVRNPKKEFHVSYKSSLLEKNAKIFADNYLLLNEQKEVDNYFFEEMLLAFN